MTRIVRSLVILGAVGLALAATEPVRACTTIDVGCATGTVNGAVGGAAGGATGIVEDTVGSASEPIGGAVDEVTRTAGGVIGMLVRGETPPVPDIDPWQVQPPGHGTRPDDEPNGPRSEPRTDQRERTVATATVRARRSAPAPLDDVSPATVISSIASSAPARAPEPFRDPISAVVPSLLGLVGLFGVVISFVVVQGWLDRRDPRLAAAPPADEMAMFR